MNTVIVIIFFDIFVFDYESNAGAYVRKKISAASANAAIFGVPKMFVPIWSWSSWLSFWNRWGVEINNNDDNTTHYQHQHSNPRNWTYLYDHSPLAKTLDKYIDYKKLNLPTTASSSSSPTHRQEGSSCVTPKEVVNVYDLGYLGVEKDFPEQIHHYLTERRETNNKSYLKKKKSTKSF